jgi:RNA polymerase sigma factor (sigma-70 family)
MTRLIPSATKSRSMMMAVMLGAALASNASADSGERANETLSAQTVWDIARYCQVCWKNARLPADHWEDCTQQVLTRLLERVSLKSWSNVLQDESEERREFFRAIDTVKKRSQRTKRHSEIMSEMADRQVIETSTLRDQWEEVMSAANNVLSPRQQRILELSRDGWNVPEIASELNTSPERISDEKYKAIRKLRTELGIDQDA